MRLTPLIRVRPVDSKTPMRMIVSAVGRVFTAKGGGVRVVEMRPTRQMQQGHGQASIEVTETMNELESLWPGFVRLHAPLNDGGLAFLLNVQHVNEYSIVETRDSQTGKTAGHALAVHLEGRFDPILVGEHWGVADEKIMAARARVDDYLMGNISLKPEEPDAGLVAG